VELRLAVAGIGNNIAALVQGKYFYHAFEKTRREGEALPGIKREIIGGFRPYDFNVCACFDVHPGKIGTDVSQAIFCPPNCYPDLRVNVPHQGVPVVEGLTLAGGELQGMEQVIRELRRTRPDVLLYSLPTGLQWAADGYSLCCLEAGVSFVNCTPEIVARNPERMAAFQRKKLALLGDDLASHIGASVVHSALLELVLKRGLDLVRSYQINIGGNSDFENLFVNGKSKAASKKNAIAHLTGTALDQVEIIPSGGFVSQLKDEKVAMINIEGRGWAGTPFTIDLKLKVQDSSNAAGVIIDLIRFAAANMRDGIDPYSEADSLLKSPPKVAQFAQTQSHSGPNSNGSKPSVCTVPTGQ